MKVVGFQAEWHSDSAKPYAGERFERELAPKFKKIKTFQYCYHDHWLVEVVHEIRERRVQHFHWWLLPGQIERIRDVVFRHPEPVVDDDPDAWNPEPF